MRIIVAPSCPRKLSSVKKIVTQILGKESIVEGQTTESSKVNTPWDEQTLIEARERAKSIKSIQGDLWVGLKSGLVDRYGDIYEEAWVCVLVQNNKRFFGNSGVLKALNRPLAKLKQS